MTLPPRSGSDSTTAQPSVNLEEQILRMCSEYLEMPGLRLTLNQAQRLWGFDEAACAWSLRCLVDAKFLVQLGDQSFARLTEGPVVLPPLRMAKAGLSQKLPSSSQYAKVG